MKRVIKNQKKMKNIMYIVFGVFALALFAITRSNPSYASDGLILDDALDMIAGGNVVENPSPENNEGEENQTIESEDIAEPEIIMEDEIEDEGEGTQGINEEGIENTDEGDSNEISQDSEDVDLEGNDDEKEKTEITEGTNENNTVQEEIGEPKNEDNNTNQETHGVSSENIDNEEIDLTNLGDFESSKMDNPNLRILNGNEFTVTYHPNGGFFPGMEKDEILEVKYSYNGETIYINNIQIPNRTVTNGDNCKGWMFAGWFTHTGVNNDRGNEWLGIIDENTESQTVYAKWLKFNDLSFNFSGNNIKIMDRNLGAEQTANGNWNYGYGPFDDERSLGFYFKRGNNHGFREDSPLIINEDIDVSGYGILTGYYSSTYQEKPDNKDLWGYSSRSDFDKQGPCPLGYHIPAITEWKKFNELFYENTDCSSYQDKMTCYGKVLKLPYSTHLRTTNDGTYDDYFDFAEHKTPYIANFDMYTSDSMYPHYIPINELGGFRKENTGPTTTTTFNNYLYPIRCFENTEPTRTVTIDYSDGNVIEYGLHWREEKIPSSIIGTIKKDGYRFNGRYNTDTLEKISTSTIINSDISIKAMGECLGGYYESSDGYSCLPYTGTVSANGGIGDDLTFQIRTPSNTYKNKGYKFVGWNTSENGDGEDYNVGKIIESQGIKLYAKWEKNPRYHFYSNIESQGNNEDILKYEDIIVVSHTDNVNDEGETVGGYYNNKTYDKTEILSITGAIALNIKVKYFGNKSNNSPDADYFLIWTGSHTDYSNTLNSGEAIKMYSGWDNYDYETFTITGNSITIGFKSFENTSGPGYGYHIIVEGYGYYKNDINLNPIRSGYTFMGWYETGATEPFDFEKIPVTQDRTFYAKWNANTYTVSFNADNGEVNPGNITVIYDSQYPELPVVNKTGYTFSGWYNGEEIVNSGDIVKIIEDVTLKAKRNINQYKIIFDTDGGNEISPIEKDYNSVINTMLPTPTKECNEFSGWDMELPEKMPAHDITLKAIWNYTCSKSSGGGGEKKSEPSTSEVTNDTTDEHNSATDDNTTKPSDTTTQLNEETSKEVISVTQEITEDGTEVEVVLEAVAIKNTDIVATVRTEIPVDGISSSISSSSRHTKEENEAYSFAKSNGITTTSDIEKAKMNTDVTRIQMAKMLSNYATNVLGKEPDASKGTVKFNDVTNKMDEQYDNAVTKAYQLGIMGQNVKNNEFRPNDEVTRAEFTTALSRLLYSTEEGKNKGTGKYYIPHIAKLYNEGIINKADPSLKEKRGYVMTMLMRTVK